MNPRPPKTEWAAGAEEPQPFGDHVRARRLGLGLYRREAGDLLGVDETTVCGRESNRFVPSARPAGGVVMSDRTRQHPKFRDENSGR